MIDKSRIDTGAKRKPCEAREGGSRSKPTEGRQNAKIANTPKTATV